MLRSVLFLFLINAVFTNSDASKHSGEEVINGNNAEGEYRFNHPPSVDNYNIPVAVIYDDASSGISEQPKAVENIKLPENVKIPARNDSNKATDSKRKHKSRRLSEVQIPVDVVYEDDLTNTDIVTEKPKKGSHQRGVDTRSSSENVYTEKSTENSNRNSNVRTFPKRLSGRDPVVPIIDEQNYVFSHSGNFHYRYESGDGTMAYSEGKLKKVNEGKGEAVSGGFSYTDDDGNDFSLTYTADENGYRPVGAHLPTPPPIPPAIARALAYLATATPEPVTMRPKKHKDQEV